MDNQIDCNLRETITHGTIEFPFVIYRKKFDGNNLSYISCHWHNEIELVYCNEGEISYSVMDKAYILNQDNFIVVNQNILHQADMIKEAKWYAILFDPKLLYGFDESKIKEVMQSIKFQEMLIKDKYLIAKLKSLINIYFNDKSIFKEMRVKSALIELYLEILNLVNNVVDKLVISTNQIKMHQMLEYIYANYKSKITIDDICKEIGACRSEVCKIFKDSLNISIADYILKLRIEKSITLLLSDKLSIQQIAAQSGFNSASYYSEAFKKVINMTPLEYKKKNARI